MRFGEKVLWGAVGLVLLLLMATWFIFATVNIAGDCGSDEVTRIRSPNGRHDAVVYTFSCGATTGYSTQIAVLPPGRAVTNTAGNVTAFEGRVKVQLNWNRSDSLTLIYDGRPELLEKPTNVGGVRIVYDSLHGGGFSPD